MQMTSPTLITDTYHLPYLNITPQSNQSHTLVPSLKQLGTQATPIAVTLDLIHIKTLESPAWLRDIRSTLKQYNMILVGIYNPQLNLEICKALKIPVFNELNSSPVQSKGQNETMYIEKPIRSGQQIYADSQSIVITKSVSSGAEIAAQDNVFIFGAVNGKIIAGAKGNIHARIIIQEGYPEMISITGVTWYSDQITHTARPQQFYLKDGQLVQENL